MPLEAYAKWRKGTRASSGRARAAHRAPGRARHGAVRKRAVDALPDSGDAAHREDSFEEEGIQDEIDAYALLEPDGTNWKATMMIEVPGHPRAPAQLARLIGIEDHMFVEVEGHGRVYAIAADEDLIKETPDKTSAVLALSSRRRCARRSAPAPRSASPAATTPTTRRT